MQRRELRARNPLGSVREPRPPHPSMVLGLPYFRASLSLAFLKLITLIPARVGIKQSTCSRFPKYPTATNRFSPFRTSPKYEAERKSNCAATSKPKSRSRRLRSCFFGSNVISTSLIVAGIRILKRANQLRPRRKRSTPSTPSQCDSLRTPRRRPAPACRETARQATSRHSSRAPEFTQSRGRIREARFVSAQPLAG